MLQYWKRSSGLPNKLTHLAMVLSRVVPVYVCVCDNGSVNTSTALTEAAFCSPLAPISNSWKVWAATFLLSALPKLSLPSEHAGKWRNYWYFADCRCPVHLSHTHTQTNPLQRLGGFVCQRNLPDMWRVCVCVRQVNSRWWSSGQWPWIFRRAPGHISGDNRCDPTSTRLVSSVIKLLCLLTLL